MRKKRQRNDQEDTLYEVSNAPVGRPGEIEFDQQDMKKLRQIVNRSSKLYVVEVELLHVFTRGYRMLVAAPAALPTRETVESHFRAYYRASVEMPDFADPTILRQWAERLRDISQFVKDVEQAFTHWLNQVKCHGERRGTSWCSRFQSAILGSARHIFAALANNFTKTKSKLGRACFSTGGNGASSSFLRRFQKMHPLVATACEISGKLGMAIGASLVTRRPYPLQQAIRQL